MSLLALLLSLATVAAAPEQETQFVDAAKRAFDEKKPAELSKLTCWDGVSEPACKKQEETFKLLVEEKDVTFGVKLVDADLKEPVKDHKEDGVLMRPNLRIVKQLDVTLMDKRDKKTLGIIGFAVGEKDGNLLLVREAPAR